MVASNVKSSYESARAASVAYRTKKFGNATTGQVGTQKSYSQLVKEKGITTAKVSGGSTASASHEPTYSLPPSATATTKGYEVAGSLSKTVPVTSLTKETHIYVNKDNTAPTSFTRMEMIPTKEVRFMDVSKGFLAKTKELLTQQKYEEAVRSNRERLYKTSKSERAGDLISSITTEPEYIRNAPTPLSSWVHGTKLTMGEWKRSAATEIKAEWGGFGRAEKRLTQIYSGGQKQLSSGFFKSVHTIGFKVVVSPFKNPLGFAETVAIGAITPGFIGGVKTGTTFFLGKLAGQAAFKSGMAITGGWYAGSVAARIITSYNKAATFGEILGEEFVPFSIGYGIGSKFYSGMNLKEIVRVQKQPYGTAYGIPRGTGVTTFKGLSGKNNIRIVKDIPYEKTPFIKIVKGIPGKTSIKFFEGAAPKTIGYAPKTSLTYAPRISGEILTPGMIIPHPRYVKFGSDADQFGSYSKLSVKEANLFAKNWKLGELGSGVSTWAKLPIEYSPKTKGIFYAAKEPIVYEGKGTGIEYAPKSKIGYAPKIKGEIFTEGYRPISKSPWTHYPSDYDQFGMASFRTGKIITQPSEWANYKEPLNAFNIETTGKVSGWTAEQKLKSWEVIKTNLPHKFSGQQYVHYPEVYHNVDTGWATELTKPTETFKGLTGKYHPPTEITGDFTPGKPPTNFGKGVSYSPSRQDLEYVYHIRTLVEQRDLLTDLGRSGNTGEIFKHFYQKPFDKGSPDYNLNIEYFNAETNYMRFPSRPTPPTKVIGGFKIGGSPTGIKITQTNFNIGKSELGNKIGWAKGQLRDIGVLNALKLGSNEKLGIKTELWNRERNRNLSLSIPAFSIKSIQDTGLRSGILQKQEVVQIQDVTPVSITRTTHGGGTRTIKPPKEPEVIITPYTPFTPGRPPKITINEKPPVPNVPGIPLVFKIKDAGLFRSSSKRNSPLFSSFKTRYMPSVEAGVFNLKGSMPSPISIRSGITLRPIIW